MKIKCIETVSDFTVGKVYDFTDGVVSDCGFRYYGVKISNLEELKHFNKNRLSKFEQIFDSNNILPNTLDLTLGNELISPQGEIYTILEVFTKKCTVKMVNLVKNGQITRKRVEELEGWENDYN